MRGRTILFVALVLIAFSGFARADEARSLVEEAVKLAGGADKIPKILRWKEPWFLGESSNANPREALLVPPTAWYSGWQEPRDRKRRPNRKAYLVWVWTLAPLLALDSKLTLLPESTVGGKPIVGVRLTRDQQKDIDIYFEKENKRLARIDWRAYPDRLRRLERG